VTPHHIALTDEAVTSFSTRFKMNPPLRSREHVDAVIEGIVDRTVDAIATDHAPHHFDEKNVEFDLAPFGVIGLETAFSIAYEQLVLPKRITLSRLVDLLSCGPARIFRLQGGSLRGGALGDLTLIAMDATWEAGSYLSKAANSPFTGRTMHGRIGMTVVGGVVKFDGGMKTPVATPTKKKSPARGGKKKP
jgi:dihydroorotase